MNISDDGRVVRRHLPLRGEVVLDGQVEVLAAGGVEGEGPPQGLHRERLVLHPRVDRLVADALGLALLPPVSADSAGRPRGSLFVAEARLVLRSHLDHNAVVVVPAMAVARRRGDTRRQRQGDVAPAEGAARAALQPRVDAVDVEGVGAVGQQAHALPLLELAQAHGALRHRYPRRGAAAVLARLRRELDDREHADERLAEAAVLAPRHGGADDGRRRRLPPHLPAAVISREPVPRMVVARPERAQRLALGHERVVAREQRERREDAHHGDDHHGGAGVGRGGG
jgi:hypothetical protein